MAVTNLNPGVGPANSDIAATIATTPAVSAQITANVPTASAIASAVAAPSLAQITSAITTNAASAGVTLAAIGTQVANNASPFGGTWTSLGNVTPGDTNTVTFNNIGGYKRYRLIFNPFTTLGFNSCGIRLNGSTSDYVLVGAEARINDAAAWQQNQTGGSSRYSVQGHTTATSQGTLGWCDIFEASSAGWKELKSEFFYNRQGQGINSVSYTRGFWKNTAAITSITFVSDFNFTNGITNIQLFGGN